MYVGNMTVQIQATIKSNLEEIIKSVKYHKDTRSDQAWQLIKNPLFPCSKIHDDDFENVVAFRGLLGMIDTEIVDKKSKQKILKKSFEFCYRNIQETLSSLNAITWTLHCWIIRFKNREGNDKKCSLLPLSSIGRKFAYIDHKVASNLIKKPLREKLLKETKDHDGSELQKIFGLTPQLFNKRRKEVRKRLRSKSFKRHKKCTKSRKGSKSLTSKKRLNKKWKNLGAGCLSKRSIVRSISTDGVGLRLCLETIPGRSRLNYDVFQVTKDTFKVAGDTGRVRIVTTVDSNGDVKMITRKGYYNYLRDKKTRKYIEEQMQNTPWGEANNVVASSGGFKNTSLSIWRNAIQALGNNVETLKNYQLVPKEQAFRKMKALRRKKAFFDQRLRDIIRPDKNSKENILIGLGDGEFACTGKGEQAVPTSSLGVLIRRIIKILQLSRRVRIVILNEFNTTCTCHRCGNVMEKLKTSKGKECLRYRLCKHCDKTKGMRRQRDVNSCKNHMKLLACDIQGLGRPKGLEIPEWFWNKKTSTWVSPIC
jgi:hypothetical protein